jgi:uncharacterized Zn ribbon protein
MTEEVYYDEERNEIPMPLEERKKHLAEKEVSGKFFDAFGNELHSGDTIISVKPLPVKWWVDIKQWEKFTRIKCTDDSTYVIAKHEKNGEMYLKTEFFKKW